MNRLIIKLLIPFFIVLTALAVSARAMGRMQPPSAVLTGFTKGCTDKPQPCWYGIVPGLTSVQEVMAVMTEAGEPDVSRSIFSRDYTLIFELPAPFCRLSLDFVQEIVVQGQIFPCAATPVHVGDLAAYLNEHGQFVSLPPNDLVYNGFSVNVAGWPEPYSRIYFMNLLAPDVPFQHYPWLGFASRPGYCQRVPDYPLCSAKS